jgi:hypothetical protein
MFMDALDFSDTDSATVANGWRIDHTAGRPILVYKNCSVIEADDAHYVLRLIHADQQRARGTEVSLMPSDADIQLLSYDERHELYVKCDPGRTPPGANTAVGLQRAAVRIDRARRYAGLVQEPVAWLVKSKTGMVRCAWTEEPTQEQRMVCAFDGDTIMPLYAH